MTASEQEKQELEEIPKGQYFMDNLMWLFIISMVISLVVYNLWGWLEVMSVPLP